jgi:hypothetical protein
MPKANIHHSDIQNKDYTIKELSEITGKVGSSIQCNIYAGWTVDEILGLVEHINPNIKPRRSDIQNKDYTIKELSEITGKAESSIRCNLQNGWTVDEILGLVEHIDTRAKPRHSNIQNKDYTAKELSEITGKSYSSILSNLDAGWTVDEILGLVEHIDLRIKPHHSDIQNKDYAIKELSEITGKSCCAIRCNI